MRSVGIVTENSMCIEFQTKEQAEKAVRIVRKELATIPADRGFGWRTKEIADLLSEENGKITLSDDCEALPVLDYIDVMKGIMKAVAKELIGSSFSFCFNASDSMFAESFLEGSFDGSDLSLEYEVLGGDGLGCPCCGEYVMPFDEYEEGESYSCPSCGSAIDVSDAAENEAYIHVEETIKIKN